MEKKSDFILFLCQVSPETNQVIYDFELELVNAVKYQNWCVPDSMGTTFCTFDELNELDILTCKCDIERVIPIGSVEFVTLFLKKYMSEYVKLDVDVNIQPRNLPECLFNYAKRVVKNVYPSSVYNKKPLFAKSNHFIKDESNGKNYDYEIRDYFDNKYTVQISELLIGDKEIVSEYRCFIHNQKLSGLQNYSGDFTVFPDVNIIKEMIDVLSAYIPYLREYTLDVAVLKDESTVPIEVHDFFSCGTYGFSDLNILPYMFFRSYKLIEKQILSSSKN
jgi:hypothetical protein